MDTSASFSFRSHGAWAMDFDAFGYPSDSAHDAIERLVDGDEDLWKQVVTTHVPRLYALAARLCRSMLDAELIVKGVFVYASDKIGALSSFKDLGPWLHRLTIESCVAIIAARPERPGDTSASWRPVWRADGQPAESPCDWPANAVAALTTLEGGELVRSLIDSLPEDHRLALLIHDVEGLPVDESACILGTTRSVMLERLHRARLALRRLLDPHVKHAAARLSRRERRLA